MKIALGQMHIRWEDKAANLARVESWAELLKEKNIDLFVLPEMSLTGFSMHTELTKETDNITVAEAERLARKYQMAVGIGWVKDVGKFCENRYSIVTPDTRSSTRLVTVGKIGIFREGLHCRCANIEDIIWECRSVMICVFRKPFRLCPVRQI